MEGEGTTSALPHDSSGAASTSGFALAAPPSPDQRESPPAEPAWVSAAAASDGNPRPRKRRIEESSPDSVAKEDHSCKKQVAAHGSTPHAQEEDTPGPTGADLRRKATSSGELSTGCGLPEDHTEGTKVPWSERARPAKPKGPAACCPRCQSANTKFCYFNNHVVSQPRYFCKACQRYWTEGGALRDVPVGAGRRKPKQTSSARSSGSLLSTQTATASHLHSAFTEPQTSQQLPGQLPGQLLGPALLGRHSYPAVQQGLPPAAVEASLAAMYPHLAAPGGAAAHRDLMTATAQQLSMQSMAYASTMHEVALAQGRGPCPKGLGLGALSAPGMNPFPLLMMPQQGLQPPMHDPFMGPMPQQGLPLPLQHHLQLPERQRPPVTQLDWLNVAAAAGQQAWQAQQAYHITAAQSAALWGTHSN